MANRSNGSGKDKNSSKLECTEDNYYYNYILSHQGEGMKAMWNGLFDGEVLNLNSTKNSNLTMGI